jgi:hypothetical protein
VKKPGASIGHGVPTSVGLIDSGRSVSASANSRDLMLFARTISPSTLAMSRPRPTKWFETEPPEVYWS